jgi:hypothetical protein
MDSEESKENNDRNTPMAIDECQKSSAIQFKAQSHAK